MPRPGDAARRPRIEAKGQGNVSEHDALSEIREEVLMASRHLRSREVNEIGRAEASAALIRAHAVVNGMIEQLDRDVHVNPGLVMFGNPPVRLGEYDTVRRGSGDLTGVRLTGLIGTNVHQIKYEHAEDKKAYVHDIEEPGTALWAATWKRNKILVLMNRDSLPLWQDFK